MTTASLQLPSCKNPAPMNVPHSTVIRKPWKLRRSSGRRIAPGAIPISSGMLAASQHHDSQSLTTCHGCSALVMAFLRNKRLRESSEFKDLPPATREFLERPTVPDYELATHTPPLYINSDEELKPTDTYLSILAFWMNPQSTGSVQLHSKDPKDQMLIDPRFLSHPFDRRAAIEAMRANLEMIEMPSLKNDTIKLIGGPKSNSDEDILVCDYSPLLLPIQSSGHIPRLLTTSFLGIHQDLSLLLLAHVRYRQNGKTI